MNFDEAERTLICVMHISKFKMTFKFDGLEQQQGDESIPNFLNDLCILVSGSFSVFLEEMSLLATHTDLQEKVRQQDELLSKRSVPASPSARMP